MEVNSVSVARIMQTPVATVHAFQNEEPRNVDTLGPKESVLIREVS